MMSNEVRVAVFHQAATLAKQGRSASMAASPFADTNRLGSLPADADFSIRPFLSGPPMLAQRSPSVDAPTYHRPVPFAGYAPPRHLSEAAVLSRAPSAPVIPRHILTQQLGGLPPSLDLQHGRSLEPSISRALLQNPRGAFGHPPLPNHMQAGIGGQGSTTSWLNQAARPHLAHNTDLTRMMLEELAISKVFQKGLGGQLDGSINSHFSHLVAPATPTALQGLAVSASPIADYVGPQTQRFQSSMDGIVSSNFLPDSVGTLVPFNALVPLSGRGKVPPLHGWVLLFSAPSL
jgi:hypothetical protein